MKANGIDIYVVPTDDFHQSEYVGEHFKARAYITGFTGSAGTAVITTGRSRTVDRWKIFPQADKQLKGLRLLCVKWVSRRADDSGISRRSITVRRYTGE